MKTKEKTWPIITYYLSCQIVFFRNIVMVLQWFCVIFVLDSPYIRFLDPSPPPIFFARNLNYFSALN